MAIGRRYRSEIQRSEKFEALLMKEMLAVSVPLACGVNAKVNDVL
jgi:hypothetical protein